MNCYIHVQNVANKNLDGRMESGNYSVLYTKAHKRQITIKSYHFRPLSNFTSVDKGERSGHCYLVFIGPNTVINTR